MKPRVSPTQHEVTLQDNDLIVSKTDLTGRITSVSSGFEQLTGYSRSEALGKRPGSGLKVWPRMWRLLRELRPAIVHTRNLAALEANVPAWIAGIAARERSTISVS